MHPEEYIEITSSVSGQAGGKQVQILWFLERHILNVFVKSLNHDSHQGSMQGAQKERTEHESLWKLSNTYINLLLKKNFKSTMLLVTPILQVL